jgi:hypothetical protein
LIACPSFYKCNSVTESKQWCVYIDVRDCLTRRNVRETTQLKLADKNVRLNWRDVTAIFKKIMGYLRPARHVRIVLATSSVQKVSGPNNGFAFFWREVPGPYSMLLDKGLPQIVVSVL